MAKYYSAKTLKWFLQTNTVYLFLSDILSEKEHSTYMEMMTYDIFF